MEHRDRLRYYLRRNYEVLWRRKARPIPLRFYVDSARGGYISAWKRTGKEEFRLLADLIKNKLRPKIDEFYRRLEDLRKEKITKENIFSIKVGLLELKKDELSYVEHFRRYLVRGFPERESFLRRLEWYRDRFKTIIEGLERLIAEERVWFRRIFVMGTYDPAKRNLEIHFYAPVFEGWEREDVDEGAKEIMKYFLKITDYEIPVWDEDTFGVSPERGREKPYSENECPRDYKILIYDYDYVTTRAISEFEWDLNWLDRIDELKAEIKANLRIYRGKKGRRKKLG